MTAGCLLWMLKGATAGALTSASPCASTERTLCSHASTTLGTLSCLSSSQLTMYLLVQARKGLLYRVMTAGCLLWMLKGATAGALTSVSTYREHSCSHDATIHLQH